MNPFDKGQQQQLGDWHPRQQRMSGDSISQWAGPAWPWLQQAAVRAGAPQLYRL